KLSIATVFSTALCFCHDSKHMFAEQVAWSVLRASYKIPALLGAGIFGIGLCLGVDEVVFVRRFKVESAEQSVLLHLVSSSNFYSALRNVDSLVKVVQLLVGVLLVNLVQGYDT